MGGHYEVTDSTVTKYYFAGAQRVAMRTGSMLYYLLSDHLGSTSITTKSNGAMVSELRYKPWGEVRYPVNGQNPGPSEYTYTGQYSNMGDFGLMFYNARWYDPALGRFAQADTITPGGMQGLDRYAYANNNPIRYNDPSGHIACDDQDENGNCINYEQIQHRAIMNLRRQFMNFEPFKTYGKGDMIPITVLTIGPWSWGDKFSPDELDLFKYDDGTLNRALLRVVGLIARTAVGAAMNSFPDRAPDGTPGNAFQHAYLSAMLTQAYGSEFAESLTNAHETRYGQDAVNGLATFMDRYNNAVGIRIAEANPNADNLELVSLIMEALENGELAVLDVDSIRAGNWTANTIYPSDQCPQLCTYP